MTKGEGKTIATIASVLDAKTRKGFVEQVLLRARELDEEKRSALDAWFSPIKLKGGFRSWSDAPEPVVAAAAVKERGRHGMFWRLVVDSWLDLRPEVKESAEKALSGAGLATTCVCWAEDAEVRWEPEALAKAVASTRSGLQFVIQDQELAFILQVISRGLPKEDEKCPEELHGGAAAGEAIPPKQEADQVDGALESDVAMSPEELTSRIENLSAQLKAMAPDIRACAASLADSRPPVEGLAERLGSLERDWTRLCRAVDGRPE